MKKESGFSRGSHGILPFSTKICCTHDRKIIHSLVFSSRKWKKQGKAWPHRWKVRVGAKENYEVDKFTFVPPLCSLVQPGLTLFLSACFLTTCILQSYAKVLSGDRGNLNLFKVRSW